jgi:hypothetical protein
MNGGWAKSSSDDPSRMNSGLTASRIAAAPEPAVSARIAVSTRSVVPGRTVLRRTTVIGSTRDAHARPMSAATRDNAPRSWLPFRVSGVPTQISAMSLWAMASAPDSVADRRPPATMAEIRSPSPGSTMGDSPRLTIATLAALTSTPTT